MARMIRTILCIGMSVLVPSGAARAQTLEDYDYSNLSFRGVGLSWGTIWPNKVDATGAWGLRLDLGFLGPAVRIVPSVTYWSSPMKTSELSRLADRLNELPALEERDVTITAEDLGPVDWSDATLEVDGHAVFTVPFDVITYFGLGLGIHALNGHGSAIENTFVEDLLDSVTPGVAFMVGLERDLASHFRVFGEARYTLASDVRYPGFRVGGALMLPSAGSSSLRSAVGR